MEHSVNKSYHHCNTNHVIIHHNSVCCERRLRRRGVPFETKQRRKGVVHSPDMSEGDGKEAGTLNREWNKGMKGKWNKGTWHSPQRREM